MDKAYLSFYNPGSHKAERMLRSNRIYIGLEMIAAALLLSCAVTARTQTLRDAGESDGILIGTAVRAPQLAEKAYASTLAAQYDMVEAEDAMKWWVLHPDSSTYDFHQGDEIVRFGQVHRMKVRGHCLVWGRNNPAWLAEGHFTEKQLSRLLREHINRVMRHYAGEVFAWDVVNEALDENGNLRDSIWYNKPGIGMSGRGADYIAQAFRWAHRADPQALLFYNEAEGEGMNRKSDAIYAMMKDFKRQHVPIDGVGLQLHIPSLDIDADALAHEISANIRRLAGLGLQVHITELDVSVPLDAAGNSRSEDIFCQAEIYREIVRACLDQSACTAIQTWGFTDKYSWIGSHSRGARGRALPFDRSYEAKPAYRAIFQELSAGRVAGH